MIHVTLIRHGRTAMNAGEGEDERFRGMLDAPLAPEGLTQAQVTAHHLSRWPLSAVYASPLQRAARTAEIIARPHHLVSQSMPGLRSMNFGDWAGRTHAEVARQWPDVYRSWRRDPFSTSVPGGESIADLRDRALGAVQRAVDHHQDGDTLVLITHQVVAKVLVCALAGLPDTAYWRVQQDLCSLTRFDYDPERHTFTLVTLNDTCHLTPAVARTDGDGTHIILVRHGQTGWNAGAAPGGERFRGRTDLPLTETGRAQAGALAEWLLGERIDALYTSPLLRARQTVEPLAGELGIPPRAHNGLLDINYGHLQGMTRDEAAASYPDLVAAWQVAPSQVQFPGGEGLAQVQARLTGLLDELVARHRGQTVVLTGHEIVNRVLACTLLGLDLDQIWRVRQDPAGIDVFQQGSDGWLTLCLNDTCHLQELSDRTDENRDS